MPSQINKSLRTDRNRVLSSTLFSFAVAFLWVFPSFWYTGKASNQRYAWFAEQTQINGWQYKSIPVGEAAEAVLVADRVVNGEFTGGGSEKVSVFSAKRYSSRGNQIGLFSHTPDRCWTSAGWRIENASPDHVECRVHGLPIVFERRVFTNDNQKELVLFGGLVGGKSLPYRLDQYHSAAFGNESGSSNEFQASLNRLARSRLWGWAWEAFVNRTPFTGPQHFLRVSTPVSGGDIDAATKLLTEFLGRFLVVSDYKKELDPTALPGLKP